MKLLLICKGAPSGVGGGDIGANKAYVCIKEICQENGIDFKCVSPDNNPEENLGCELKKNRSIDLLARVFGHTTSLYVMWLKYREKIFAYSPDIVISISSRLGFVTKSIARRNKATNCIVAFENVECDYAIVPFLQLHSLLRTIFTRIERMFVVRDEKAALKYGASFIFLSDRDYKRTREIYGREICNHQIIPACIQSEIRLTINSPKPTIVFVSSLQFKQNVASLLWFLDNVWNVYFKESDSVNFIVAGAEPPPIVVERLKDERNVKLYKNFKHMADIIPRGALHISPITVGAGMKVKIAEALAAGLHILGTDEALVGYSECFGARGIRHANTPGEYKIAIEKYIALGHEEIEQISRENQELFHRFYTYARAKEGYEKVLKSVVVEEAN
ncbi:MAG: glycosyltransferase [Oscillospiraceae bacterium]|nr:glycosyltransferase [Oscillospiraceae bacterium]